MSGYSLNPNAVEFSFPNDLSPNWNTLAVDFVPFEPSPPAPVSSSPPVQASIPEVQKPAKKIYTYEVLISLREANKQLPEGVSIPDTYSKTGGKSKNSKKGSQSTKSQTIKRAENQLNNLSILVKTEKPFTEKMKKEADELEKKSREIRSILNKLTDRNFDKLLVELTSFEYDQQLLANLTNFIFERATAMNFPKLYSRLCQSLRKSFKEKNLSSTFRKSIVNKCHQCFYNSEEVPSEPNKLMEAEFKRRRRLIGNIKFIALLHQAKMIKSEIMFECFDVLLEPKSLSDETLETCITLFKDTCPILIDKFTENIHNYYEKIIGFMNSPMICKRICFMIQDLIDIKDRIMIPGSVKIVPVQKPVQVEEEEEVVENIGLKENVKADIKCLTAIYVKDGTVDDSWEQKFAKIFKDNETMHTEIIVQILKHSLYEFADEDKTVAVCRMIKMMVKNFNLEKNIIQQSIIEVQKVFGDIVIDNPTAITYYAIMENQFKQN